MPLQSFPFLSDDEFQTACEKIVAAAHRCLSGRDATTVRSWEDWSGVSLRWDEVVDSLFGINRSLFLNSLSGSST